MIWQSKQVLKSQKQWQKPTWVNNRPKGMTKEDWEYEVKEWKLNKQLILGIASKNLKSTFAIKDKNEDDE